MTISNLGSAYMNCVPPRDEGDTDQAVDFSELAKSPEMQAIIQTRIDQEVQGLKRKNSELIDKGKELKANVSQYDGLDIEKLTTLQKQLEENEELRLLGEGKMEEVFTRRTDAMKKDSDQQIASLTSKIDGYEAVLLEKDEAFTKLVVDADVRQAYTILDFEPTAMEDIVSVARRTFIMGEDGKAVPRDNNGDIIFGKDGKTAVSTSEWLEGLVENRPYLRRASSGAGANGSSGRSGRGGVDTSKMSSVQRIAHGLRQGQLNR